VDVIYIGTPPNFHHQNAKEALLAGKHVLCEKPFTFDLEELDELIALAKSKNLFLMESAPLISYQYYSGLRQILTRHRAVWTRFHPLAGAVREVLASGTLGKPLRFTADFSMDWNLDSEYSRTTDAPSP
jgi:predicted dehydrogenase